MFVLKSKVGMLHNTFFFISTNLVWGKTKLLIVLFFKDFIILFSDRGGGREKDWERNISVWLPLMLTPWRPGLQARHVPWLGNELATLWFVSWCSIYWATPTRAYFLKLLFKYSFLHFPPATPPWPPISTSHPPSYPNRQNFYWEAIICHSY